MHPKVFDMLYVILAACWIRGIGLLIRILSSLAESCQLRCLRLKIHRQHVGAGAAGKAQDVAECLRRRFRQEWNAVLPYGEAVQECVRTLEACHIPREKWPLE